MRQTYIGLGSNLGHSQALLIEAVVALRQLGQVRVSRLYASAPMGPQDQPDYLNAVVALTTDLTPDTLLRYTQQCEQAAGRVRQRHWGERTLDLDILLMDGVQIDLPHLVIPHVGILQRAFVVQPLLDVWPDAQVGGVDLRDLAVAQTSEGIRVVADSTWIDPS
ncbi:MAG: 2-amino-4-hydroxy-6-hydroxymethyldihydropteridine diphosphokinase [Pseudomonadota bacterium]|nr:2-amino-4-hydroxy-6-hydroxymethyldihydropteridine diphosphokinase [Pseudomonadota bacterium]